MSTHFRDHCPYCAYGKIRTETDSPCNVCRAGDEWRDPRWHALEVKANALEAENARFRKALEEIARVRRGLEMTDTDEYRADYFFRQADNYSDLARKALRGPSPA